MKPVVGLLRQLGIRLIVHLDDMVTKAQSQDLTLQHATTALDLLEGLGFMINQQKSILIPATKMEFLSFVMDSFNPVFGTPSGQNQKSQERMSELDRLPPSIGEKTGQVALSPYLYHSSCLSWAPPLPPLAKREDQGFHSLSNLRIINPLFHSSQRGVGLVEGQPGSLERESPCFGFSRLSNRDRCLLTRLGGILQQSVNGAQWPRGESLLHIHCLESLSGAFAVKRKSACWWTI